MCVFSLEFKGYFFYLFFIFKDFIDVYRNILMLQIILCYIMVVLIFLIFFITLRDIFYKVNEYLLKNSLNLIKWFYDLVLKIIYYLWNKKSKIILK